MITTLKEIQLPNFNHMTTSTIQFESHDKVLLVTSWTEIMSSTLFQNTFILRKATMFIKQPLKTQKKLKKLEIMYQNAIYVSIF